jgi:hypothetical protein
MGKEFKKKEVYEEFPTSVCFVLSVWRIILHSDYWPLDDQTILDEKSYSLWISTLFRDFRNHHPILSDRPDHTYMDSYDSLFSPFYFLWFRTLSDSFRGLPSTPPVQIGTITLLKLSLNFLLQNFKEPFIFLSTQKSVDILDIDYKINKVYWIYQIFLTFFFKKIYLFNFQVFVDWSGLEPNLNSFRKPTSLTIFGWTSHWVQSIHPIF